jgi:elongation factor Ts
MAEITAALVKELRERTGLGMMDCKKALIAANGDMEQAIEDLRKEGGLKAAKKAGRTAAEGLVLVKVASDNSKGVILEVNSETDFAARESNFATFARQVLDASFEQKESNVEKLMVGELEAARLALVQKIGENITVRRIAVTAEEGQVVGSYVHSNDKIAVLVSLKSGDEELAKDIAMHVAAVNPMVVKAEDVPAEVLSKESEIYTAQAAESGKPSDIVEKMVSGRLKKFIAEVTLTEQPFVKDPDVTIGKLLADANAEIVSFTRYEVGEGIEKQTVDFAAEVAEQLKG